MPAARPTKAKRWLVFVLPFVMALATAAVIAQRHAPSGASSSDILARVNGEDIAVAELRRVRADLLDLGDYRPGAERSMPDPKQLNALAVEQLIERQLMLQEATRRKLSVDDAEIYEALGELRSRFADLETMAGWMRARGFTDASLIEAIRRDLLAAQLRDQLVAEIVVTEEEIRQYYEAQADGVAIGEQVRLGLIVVASLETGSQVMAALEAGESFTRLGQEHATAPSGDTGWLDSATLPAPLRRAVIGMSEGEVYGPIRKADDEFVIMALAGRRPVIARSFAEARESIEQSLLSGHRRRAVAEWLAQQKERAEIEIFAVDVSAVDVVAFGHGA